MHCKQCGEPFSKNEGHDIWELKRRYVGPASEAHPSESYFEDAGLFCSRNCLRDYLSAGGNKSGIFNLKKPTL